MANDTKDTTARHVWRLIKDIPIALMVTQSADGTMHARPMAALPQEFAGELWYFTHDHAPKVQEIEHNPQVLINYARPEANHFVCLRGTAAVVRDRQRIQALWQEDFRTWFPGGADDTNIALLHVQITEAEYWDSPSSTYVKIYGVLQPYFGAPTPDHLAEHARVCF